MLSLSLPLSLLIPLRVVSLAALRALPPGEAALCV
jgi:hypothetical protein